MVKLLSSKKVQRGILAAEILFALVLIVYIISKDWSCISAGAMFTISIDCTCMIVNIIFFFGIIGSNEDFNVNFAAICVADFIALTGECAAYATENNVDTVFWAWTANTVMFIGALALSVTFYYLVCNMTGEPRNTRNVWRRTVNILAVAGLILIILNLFTGITFRILPDGLYVRGKLYTLCFALMYSVWGMALARIIISKINLKTKIFITILIIIPAVALFVSITFLGIGITCAISLVSIAAVYITYYKELESESTKLNRSFGRFLSDEIVNQIAGGKKGEPISSKYFRSTILISDIRDFTEISEKMEPDDLMKMVNHYFAIMLEVIVSYGGVTIEFMGDGLKAAFGAPNRRTDHAEAALLCAAEMQNKITEVNEWNAENGYPKLEMGIGVHTGAMIFGSIGNEMRFRYSAVGTEVCVCHFVEEQTCGGQILFSEETMNEITIPVNAKFIDEFEYNDIDRKINLYSLNSIGDIVLPYTKEEMEKLEHPVFVDVYVSQRKTFELKPVKGRIIAMSHTEAILQTERQLSKHTTLSFKIESISYNARIMKPVSGDYSYIIRFAGRNN